MTFMTGGTGPAGNAAARREAREFSANLRSITSRASLHLRGIRYALLSTAFACLAVTVTLYGMSLYAVNRADTVVSILALERSTGIMLAAVGTDALCASEWLVAAAFGRAADAVGTYDVSGSSAADFPVELYGQFADSDTLQSLAALAASYAALTLQAAGFIAVSAVSAASDGEAMAVAALAACSLAAASTGLDEINTALGRSVRSGLWAYSDPFFGETRADTIVVAAANLFAARSSFLAPALPAAPADIIAYPPAAFSDDSIDATSLALAASDAAVEAYLYSGSSLQLASECTDWFLPPPRTAALPTFADDAVTQLYSEASVSLTLFSSASAAGYITSSRSLLGAIAFASNSAWQSGVALAAAADPNATFSAAPRGFTQDLAATSAASHPGNALYPGDLLVSAGLLSPASAGATISVSSAVQPSYLQTTAINAPYAVSETLLAASELHMAAVYRRARFVSTLARYVGAATLLALGVSSTLVARQVVRVVVGQRAIFSKLYALPRPALRDVLFSIYNRTDVVPANASPPVQRNAPANSNASASEPPSPVKPPLVPKSPTRASQHGVHPTRSLAPPMSVPSGIGAPIHTPNGNGHPLLASGSVGTSSSSAIPTAPLHRGAGNVAAATMRPGTASTTASGLHGQPLALGAGAGAGNGQSKRAHPALGRPDLAFSQDSQAGRRSIFAYASAILSFILLLGPLQVVIPLMSSQVMSALAASALSARLGLLTARADGLLHILAACTSTEVYASVVEGSAELPALFAADASDAGIFEAVLTSPVLGASSSVCTDARASLEASLQLITSHLTVLSLGGSHLTDSLGLENEEAVALVSAFAGLSSLPSSGATVAAGVTVGSAVQLEELLRQETCFRPGGTEILDATPFSPLTACPSSLDMRATLRLSAPITAAGGLSADMLAATGLDGLLTSVWVPMVESASAAINASSVPVASASRPALLTMQPQVAAARFIAAGELAVALQRFVLTIDALSSATLASASRILTSTVIADLVLSFLAVGRLLSLLNALVVEEGARIELVLRSVPRGVFARQKEIRVVLENS
jgi:hypothetical protein